MVYHLSDSPLYILGRDSLVLPFRTFPSTMKTTKKYSRVLDNERMATESNPPFQNGLGSHSPRIRPSRCPHIEIHGCSRLAFSAWHSRRDHVSLAPTRPANKSWSAVSRLRRITITPPGVQKALRWASGPPWRLQPVSKFTPAPPPGR